MYVSLKLKLRDITYLHWCIIFYFPCSHWEVSAHVFGQFPSQIKDIVDSFLLMYISSTTAFIRICFQHFFFISVILWIDT